MKFKTAFSKPKRYQIVFDTPSRVKQSFAKECDINTIMSKWQKTGLLEHAAQHQGQYVECGTSESYHEACNQVIAAKAAFATLPSNLRKRFANDPAEFLAFVSNSDNREEMISMGLMRDGIVSRNVKETVQDVQESDKKKGESTA
jgi:phage internal scaffolding protein